VEDTPGKVGFSTTSAAGRTGYVGEKVEIGEDGKRKVLGAIGKKDTLGRPTTRATGTTTHHRQVTTLCQYLTATRPSTDRHRPERLGAERILASNPRRDPMVVEFRT